MAGGDERVQGLVPTAREPAHAGRRVLGEGEGPESRGLGACGDVGHGPASSMSPLVPSVSGYWNMKRISAQPRSWRVVAGPSRRSSDTAGGAAALNAGWGDEERLPVDGDYTIALGREQQVSRR
jgi:hypothetical protein